MLLSVAKIEQPFLAIKPSITFSLVRLVQMTMDTPIKLKTFVISILKAHSHFFINNAY